MNICSESTAEVKVSKMIKDMSRHMTLHTLEGLLLFQTERKLQKRRCPLAELTLIHLCNQKFG